jgi:hypothetical protein
VRSMRSSGEMAGCTCTLASAETLAPSSPAVSQGRLVALRAGSSPPSVLDIYRASSIEPQLGTAGRCPRSASSPQTCTTSAAIVRQSP